MDTINTLANGRPIAIDARHGLCYNVTEASMLPAGRSKMAFAFPLSFLQKGVSMMTDFEMLSIVIMIITLVASLLINNRDK